MISFWERFVIFREKAETPADRIYEFVFTKIDMCCEICFTPMSSNQDVVRHIRVNHQDLIDGGEAIKLSTIKKTAMVWQHSLLMKQDICPLGCGYWRKTIGQNGQPLSEDISDMRRHLILYHSHKQLKNWGVNRNYLKYIEGMISRDEMRKDVNQDLLRANNASILGGLPDFNPSRTLDPIDNPDNEPASYAAVPQNSTKMWPYNQQKPVEEAPMESDSKEFSYNNIDVRNNHST